jgi:Fur family ferric uptake transcriptional regulator
MEARVETEFRSDIEYKTLLDKFKTVLKKEGLRFTKQREVILNGLYSVDTHLTSEELYQLLKSNNPKSNIGIATVYRTLSLLERGELVTTLLTDNTKKYELSAKEHHDHIICTDCGKIIEFVSPDIERLQESVAEELGFKILDHSMQIYGICKDCRK